MYKSACGWYCEVSFCVGVLEYVCFVSLLKGIACAVCMLVGHFEYFQEPPAEIKP